ncbi:MAG: hypothetical protein AAGL68_02910 [Pseudomonadota bacterium]
MRIFNMGAARSKKTGSHLALAIALATGTAVVGTIGFADTAHAQKKKNDKEAKADYSEAFVEAYQPLNEQVNAEGADVASLKPQLTALIPLATTDDDKYAAGGLIYNAGAKTNDRVLQSQGMGMMLASNKVPPENVGRFNFIAYQLANVQEDYAKARTYLQAAIDANFTSDSVSLSDMQVAMAESYFSEESYREGLGYLKTAIEAQKSAGQPVDEQWYRRGLTVAYNNEIQPEVYDFTIGWVQDYPSEGNWRDAINLTRNLNEFEAPLMLDLMRLGHKAGTFSDKNDYIEYIEAADARRLPKEVYDVIQEAYGNGTVTRDDIYVADSLQIAEGRLAADREDLPALERDAKAAGADLRTVMIAGDVFLSYGEYTKAAEFYQKALEMAGVDTSEAQTRLGIAQAGLGQFGEAQATFAKVEGSRKPIAQLWAAYADQEGGAASAAVPATEPAETVGG